MRFLSRNNLNLEIGWNVRKWTDHERIRKALRKSPETKFSIKISENRKSEKTRFPVGKKSKPIQNFWKLLKFLLILKLDFLRIIRQKVIIFCQKWSIFLENPTFFIENNEFSHENPANLVKNEFLLEITGFFLANNPFSLENAAFLLDTLVLSINGLFWKKT